MTSSASPFPSTALRSAAPSSLPSDDVSVDEARAQIHAQISARLETADASETVGLKQALGRVLARDVISPIDVPAHDNSAMDGYAFVGAALGNDTLHLQVLGTALAGRPWQASVNAGECVRIMTGAVIPSGCDTVIPHELVAMTEPDANCISIDPGSVKSGDNCRRRGEDLAKGMAALAAGRMLRPADLGLLASLGIAEVEVRTRLRVACMSTGDELRSLGETLDAGSVYDSNRYTLIALLERMGCEVVDLGVMRDDPAALDAALRDAAARADVVLTSGGASSGDADHTTTVMRNLGDILFWKLAVRPGRPFAFGRIGAAKDDAWLFGLPGNPVAAMICFCFLVRPALLTLMGSHASAPPLLQARALAPMRKRAGRTEYQRGIVSQDEQGNTQVRLTGSQGSGVLRSMSEANCIVVLGHEQGNVAAGDMVDVVLLDSLGA